MHPAFSVIFLTTLIGAGQGLFLALYTGQVYNTFGVVGGEAPTSLYTVGTFIVLVLMGLGLFASFFHLGRPERAWRTATKWRTSWLSREVIVLPAFSGVAMVWGLMHFLGNDPVFTTTSGGVDIHWSLLVGLVGTALAFLLFLSTGMIYAAVKFIQEWASPLTVFNYTILGTASGFTLAAALAALQGYPIATVFGGWAIIFTLIGFVTRMASLYRNARIKRKTNATTALGIRHTTINQISQGAMGGSFNTREFFHNAAPQMVHLIKTSFPIATFVIPITFLIIGGSNDWAALWVLAFIIQYVGLLLERWFFFAQAWHPQNIYYQAT